MSQNPDGASSLTRHADLKRLLHPHSIAVIGATSKPRRVGSIIFEGLIRSGRVLYPVHPREREVFGHQVCRSISDLPDGIDVAVVTTSSNSAVEAAEQCAGKEIPHVIIVAGGFAEAGEEGKALEARLGAIPGKFGTRVLGPNTLGLFLPHENLDTIFVDHSPEAFAAGGVAFITQSGSVGVEGLGVAGNTGFGMRAFVGLGNKCDLSELDFLGYFAEDGGTTCLSFYLESIEGGRQFLEAARDVAREKPVVVLKAGRTPTGAAAVSSHTGRLAGSDNVIDGAFRQYGIQPVFDDEELCDASKTLSMLPPAPGNRVAIVTSAGGYGVMGTDHVETSRDGVELVMARLSPRTQQRIRDATLPFAAVGNPVDLTASASDDMFAATLDALIEDDGVDMVICVAFFAPPALTDGLIDRVSTRAVGSHKPVIVLSQFGPHTNDYLRRFYDAGVVGFPSIGRAVRAARFLVERKRILGSLGVSKRAV